MSEFQSETYDVCGNAQGAGDLATALNTFVKTVTEIMGVKGASIRLLDDRKQALQVSASYGLSKSYVEKGPLLLSENPVEREILAGKIVSTSDISKEPGALYRQQAEQEGIKSILNVPLMADHKAIGIVRVYSAEPRRFTHDEIEQLRSLSAFGGIIVERARLADQMRALVCIARTIGSTLSLGEVLQIIVENAVGALGLGASSIRLIDENRRTLEVKAAYGLSAEYLAKGPVEIEKSPIDRECLAGKCISIADIRSDTRLQYPEEMMREGIQGMLTVPLNVKGRAIGVLRVYTATPYEFNSSEIEFLIALASYGAVAIENARLFEHVKTEYEELTKDVWKWYDWGSRFPNI